MNKSMKRFVSVLLAVLLLSAMGANALAAGGDTYTIRIYAGNVEGANINGQSVWTYTGSYGEAIPFDLSMVSLPEGSKYYVKGIRESGLDNNQISPLGSITEDADYVVAYGITGELVSYTVRYVIEGTETDLAPSQTFYGNVGDKPVVSYIYIEGYEPQAYNLTWTLTESNPVVRFEYTPIVVATPEPAAPAPTPYVYTEGGAAAPAEGGGAAAGGGLPAAAGGVELPGAGGEEAVAGENVPEAGAPEQEQPAEAEEPAAAQTQEETAPAQEPVQIEEDETPQANGPQEIIDLDEEDTPLGDKPEIPERPQTDLQKEREQVQKKFYISTGLLGVSLIAIVALVVLLVKKRRA